MDREFIKIERTQGGWQLLFQKLYQIARANAGSQLVAKKPMNVIRNRYRDVLPIDSTRVILSDPDSDYINANFVKSEEVGRTYILCQGPLQHTCRHFWQMVWEQNTVGVIMLNKCVERGMNKCFPYWPQPDDPPMEQDKFQIEYVAHEDEASYRLSHLKLENLETEESRDIQHFHYTKWPDFGVPQNPEVFLEFLYAVRSSGVLETDKGPAVVHCSAGIGRSGTFCIVDAILAKLEQTHDLASADLQEVLLDMRQQRLGLVQTPDQLRFSYIAILQGALQDMELEPSSYDDLVEAEEEEEEDEEEDEVEAEDEVEESDSDELEEDQDARMERKFPNLTRQSTSQGHLDADDVPPPLPPRPPETLRLHNELASSEGESPSPTGTPPPPPPTSAPPGPPISPFDDDNSPDPIQTRSPLSPRSLQELDSDEEFGFEIPNTSSANGEISDAVLMNGDDQVEVLEESESEEEYEVNPPPIPPRSHSLSPSPNLTPFHSLGGGRGKTDIYGDRVADSATTSSSFLLRGRGGEKTAPPLPGLTNGLANGEDDDASPPPPPLPEKTASWQKSGPKLEGIVEEERMLINELDLLKKLVDKKDEVKEGESRTLENGATMNESIKSKKLRQERRERLSNKVRDIKEAMRNSEGDHLESDWSIPWLLVGFVVMLGYCAYYIIQ